MTNPLAYLRSSELKRYKKWKIEESFTSVSFVKTSDNWEIAVSKYRADPTATRQKHPVLLCHGLGCNRLAFDMRKDFSLPSWLAARGYDVYSVDLRGHGLSEKPGQNGKQWGWGFNDYCNKDLPAAIDHVLSDSGAGALNYIGHSMGGLLLYALAAQKNKHIKSGITLGSSLDYSGTATIFNAIAPLAKLTKPLPFVPLNKFIALSGKLSSISTSFIDTSLVNPDNTQLKDFQRLTTNAFHPVSSQVLRDLSNAITGAGIKDKDGISYDLQIKKNGYPFPILAISGEGDTQCSPEIAKRFGTEHKVFGASHGQQHNYGHHDLIMGKHAELEVWPELEKWLSASRR